MKILLASKGDNGGGTYWLAQAINKHTQHEARSVRILQSFIKYPFDVLNPSDEELANLCKWADLVHCRDSFDFLPEIGKGKIWVMTYTGMSYRRKYGDLIRFCRDRGWTVCVSTIDLTEYHGKQQKPPVWLPNPREDMQSRVKKHDRFTVAHAPTFRERKGTETILQAFEGLSAKLELVEGLPYSQCVKRKRKCHALIDQFAWGYGNNAIEAWAMGQPVIGGVMLEKYADVVLRTAGFLPYVPAEETVDSIRAAAQQVMDSPKWAIERGREYFHAFHHAPVVAKRAVEIYEAAL